MDTFEQYNPAQLRIPNRGPIGQALAAAIGAEQDRELALVRDALLCRSPSRCPDDALDALGRWYRIPRYPADTDTSYRARLCAAWQTWETAGSCEAIEAQIRAFGVTDVRVFEDPDFGCSHGPGPHRFSVVLGPQLGTLGASPLLLGTWVLGTSTLGFAAVDRATWIALKRIILKWKAAHAYAVELIIIRGTAGSVLGVGSVVAGAITYGLTLGSFVLGGDLDGARVPVGRPLGTMMTTLGTWTLGGYEV